MRKFFMMIMTVVMLVVMSIPVSAQQMVGIKNGKVMLLGEYGVNQICGIDNNPTQVMVYNDLVYVMTASKWVSVYRVTGGIMPCQKIGGYTHIHGPNWVRNTF